MILMLLDMNIYMINVYIEKTQKKSMPILQFFHLKEFMQYVRLKMRED